MSRLPTVGGDTDNWGTVLNDYLTETADRAVLASSPSAGATTFDLAAVPTGLAVGSIVAIDAYTTQCEIRAVTGLSGSTITVAALNFAHAGGDAMTVLHGFAHTDLYAITGDGTDEWSPLQRLFTEATPLSLTIRGRPGAISIQRPLLINQSSRINSMRIISRTGFAPTDADGAMMMVGQREFQIASATPAANTLTVTAGHGLVSYDTTNDVKVSFYAPYGETLPAPLVAGRTYYVDTIPNSTTFTVSATAGGSTFDITGDGTGWCLYGIDQLTRVFWESLYLELESADLNGMRFSLQQPAWTSNIRINMDVAATTQGRAIGIIVTGQIGYLDNTTLQTAANCTGISVTGTGMVIRNISVVSTGVDSVAVLLGGTAHTIDSYWFENMGRAGVEFTGGNCRGHSIGGSGFATTSPLTVPVFLDNSATSTYKINSPVRHTSVSQTLYSDGVTELVGADGATPALGESDNTLIFYGMQKTRTGQIILLDRFAFRPAASFTANRCNDMVLVDTTSGDITCTLPPTSASSWVGWTTTIMNAEGSNDVIIDPSGSETIDGLATLTLAPGEAVTVCSFGALFKIVSRSA